MDLAVVFVEDGVVDPVQLVPPSSGCITSPTRPGSRRRRYYGLPSTSWRLLPRVSLRSSPTPSTQHPAHRRTALLRPVRAVLPYSLDPSAPQLRSGGGDVSGSVQPADSWDELDLIDVYDPEINLLDDLDE